MRRGLRVAISVATLTCVIVGCDNSSSSSSPPPPRLDAGEVLEARAPDAASIKTRPELCQGLVRGGQPISELEHASDPPPALGGTVVPGTYDLSELIVYSGPPDPGSSGGGGPVTTRVTGRAAQITLVITEFELRSIEARGAPDGDGGLLEGRSRAGLYRTDGTSLFETEVCPGTSLPVALPFSAVGGGLALFTDAKHRELYVRRASIP